MSSERLSASSGRLPCAKKKARLVQAATEKAGTLQWTFAIPAGGGDVEDEDPFVITMRAKKPPTAPAGVVDVQEWAPLETYLRTQFEVPDSVKKLKLKVVVRLDGEIKLRWTALDPTSLCTLLWEISDLGQLLLDATAAKVEASLISGDVGKKLKAKAKPRTREQEVANQKLKDFKGSVWGGTATTRSYTTGEWTTAASDIMRREHDYMAKYFEMRGATAKVMGCADYHPSPCVLICPFATCKKSHRVLNGVSAVSQLYSHWKEGHKDNPAARVLEARWRLALDNMDKSAAWLDERQPLILSGDEMDRLGGEEEGYEPIRKPTPDPTDFKPTFELHTAEHRAWLEAVGTL